MVRTVDDLDRHRASSFELTERLCALLLEQLVPGVVAREDESLIDLSCGQSIQLRDEVVLPWPSNASRQLTRARRHAGHCVARNDAGENADVDVSTEELLPLLHIEHRLPVTLRLGGDPR